MSTHEPSEQELLIKVANGDEKSFKCLYDKYKNKIYSLSMFLTRSEYISEEITQEVFLKIWLHRENLESILYFNSYLRTIATNIASNYFKRLANEKIIMQRLAYETVQSDETTSSTVILNECQNKLKRAIESLPPQQRRVYILSFHEGYKNAEIAKIMNLSIHTVKDYIKSANSTIREQFKNF